VAMTILTFRALVLVIGKLQ